MSKEKDLYNQLACWKPLQPVKLLSKNEPKANTYKLFVMGVELFLLR